MEIRGCASFPYKNTNLTRAFIKLFRISLIAHTRNMFPDFFQPDFRPPFRLSMFNKFLFAQPRFVRDHDT